MVLQGREADLSAENRMHLSAARAANAERKAEWARMEGLAGIRAMHRSSVSAAAPARKPSLAESIATAEAGLARAKAAVKNGDRNLSLPVSIAGLERAIASMKASQCAAKLAPQADLRARQLAERKRLEAALAKGNAMIRCLDERDAQVREKAAKERARHERAMALCYGTPEGRREARIELATEQQVERKRLEYLAAEGEALAAKYRR